MGRKPLKYRFLFSIIALIFLVLVVVPVVFVFISSFTENEAFSLKHYQETYHSGTFKLLLKSCLLAASVSIAAVFTGSFFGYLLSRTNIPIPGFLKLLLLLPLFVSPYYLAVAIRNIALLADKPTSLFKNLGAVAVVLYVGLMPVALMIMSASFAAVNSRLEEAGLLVTGRLRAIWSVIFPLVRPAIVSSFILIFI
ncbi:MAG: hypothetical protein IT223_09745, partial [Crocinitomicaceae bacterium]|nr:hypothetical protein [Crocinitomicaceae bacterium]